MHVGLILGTRVDHVTDAELCCLNTLCMMDALVLWLLFRSRDISNGNVMTLIIHIRVPKEQYEDTNADAMALLKAAAVIASMVEF